MSAPQIQVDATRLADNAAGPEEVHDRVEPTERAESLSMHCVMSSEQEPSLREVAEITTFRGSSASDREEELTRLVAEREQQLAERELAYRQLLRDRELVMALSGKPLVAGAAVQLLKLWRDEFDVIEDAGSCRVVSREGRTVGQAVEEWLARPDYAHFRPAASRGGAGAGGGHQPTQTDESRTSKTLGEAIVRRWRETGAGDVGGSAAIGLNRRRSP